MDYVTEDTRMRGLDGDDDDDEDLDVEKALDKSTRRHMDDEDDDDDDEEEEEGDTRQQRIVSRKRKKRRKEMAANPYLDVIADVDDDDEDEEEDEAEGGFLEYQQQQDEDEEDDPEGATGHARLDRQRLDEMEISNEEMARRLKERYARNDRIVEDMSQVPQRMLMPSVNDPNLWQIKVKPGRERDVVLGLYRKALSLETKGTPVDITSAFERTSIMGYVYVESRSKAAVIQACSNLMGIYRRDPILVPINEMAPLLQLQKKEVIILPGAWVRFKHGKYQGDLAQVVDITDNGEEAGVRFLPRIDMNVDPEGKHKRKRGAAASSAVGRPPARPFNPEEILRIHGKKSAIKRGPSWIFQGETYTNGFLEKDVRVSALTTENVNPTLEEVSMFLGGKDGSGGVGAGLSNAASLDAMAAAVARPHIISLQPGDRVEVFQGEQNGSRGVVDSVMGDVVLIRADAGEWLDGLQGQLMEVPSRYVRKRFSAGEHVKVMGGVKMDETGMVVDVKGDLVTFVSDLTEEEITVFSKDLRTAAEVGSSSNVVGNYELHDLIQLDMQTVGVIYRTERDSFRVLDQHGQTRLVQPHQITMRRDTRRAISTDAEGNELRVGDNVKEIDGENRRGVVLHIHQATYAFLHNREILQDGGIFVTRCRSLAPIAPKGAPKVGMDLTKMNPAVAGGQGGAPSMARGPRDRLLGVNIKIIKGPQKGYAGVIKDVNGQQCRVELSTNNRIISIEKEKLRRVGMNGQLEPLEGGGGFAHPGQARGSFNGSNSSWANSSAGGRTPNPYMSDGGRTPGWGTTGRTPNPYANTRTPAWSASTQTPNPYADGGGKTPGWNPSSRTPNPYASNDGGKTPGWNPSSRTPNPYTSSTATGGHGGKTPSWEAGSRTPNPTSANDKYSGEKDGWGTLADNPPSWKSGGNSNSWNNDDGGWGATAPTPAATAPTPSPYSAATPFVMSAPTPAATAPTPSPYISETPSSYAAPTPAAYSAPTPAPGFTPGLYSAPTPGLYSAPTPRGIAQTPAAHADYVVRAPQRRRDAEPFNVSNEEWLLEFNIPNICASFKDDSSFMGGLFSSQEVVVRRVQEAREGIRSTADIELLNGEKDEISGVPIDHLQPSQPRLNIYQGRRAVLLQNHFVNRGGRPDIEGAKKEIVMLTTFGDEEWLCSRKSVPGAADIEVQATALCLMWDD